MSNFRSSALALALWVGAPLAAIQAQDASGANTSALIGPAEAIAASGTGLAARLQGLLDQARQEGDIVKVTCLNDKLAQANANLRNVKARVKALKDAAAVNDASKANHESTVVSVLGQKFQQLDQEASQCIGQDVFEPGSAQVITSVDPSIVPADVNAAAVAAATPPPPNAAVPPPNSPSS